MSFFASSSYKPQIRQEGFHLPSPSSPNPPSPPASSHFDSGNNSNVFMPQNYLPDAFRKYPAGSADTGGSSSMDFSDELASLMANSPGPTGQHHGHNQHHQSSHERSTQSPNPSSESTNYDDGYRPTHNIFDISAPQQHHQQHANSSGFPAHFSLPPTSHRPSDNIGLSQPSSLHTPHHQHLHDFNATPHSHFNSTLPALNSSMRFEPHPPGPPHDAPPPSSFNYPAGVSQAEYRANNRHTPSPIGTSRSRSRSRAPSVGPTRNSRARRNNSISSTSPPPLPGRPSAIVIPGSHRHMNGASGNGVPVSPLSLHSLSSSTSGWFMPPHGQHSTNEYNLPTPESITNPFGSSFASQPQNMGISPSDVTSLSSLKDRPSSSSLKEEKTGDPVSKQAILANEKRRRRRESHNAVERRRRDNINEKISELATLIPECMLDPTAPVASPTATDEPFNAANAPPPDLASAKKEILDDPSTPIEAGVVKANKGMILRKSVEYIRYLQQLVNAQASRNRELEQALSVYRHEDGDGDKSGLGHPGLGLALHMNGVGNGHGHSDDDSAPAQMHTPTSNDSPRPSGTSASGANGHDDMGGLMLHEEVGGDGFGMGGMNFHMGFSGMPQGKSFHGFELASMPEDAEMDDRPTTGMTMSGTSPSVGSGEGDDEGRIEEEEERGRRGRDGRPRNGAIQKYEEAEESSNDSRERREAPKISMES